jgi:beta-glucanase (GH16 family)
MTLYKIWLAIPLLNSIVLMVFTVIFSTSSVAENNPALSSDASQKSFFENIVPTNIPKGYALVWSDEFSKVGLPNPSHWKYDTHRNKEGWYNREKQYYAAQRLKNSRVENGYLILEAHLEELNHADYVDWGEQTYTSARLITQGLGDWTYGFFEIRAKIPCGTGTWPAIWMLPSDPDIKWPRGGEIDIMEHVGFDPGVIHHSVHTKNFNFMRGSQRTTQHIVADACDTFHKYQLLWTANTLLFAVDEKPKFLYKKTRSGQSRWPFDKPQHLLLNIAVGGTWGGQKGVRKDSFPAKMEIDYVRVYQPKTQEVIVPL